eukprot:SAG11_NODE_8919_length_962_cov_0.895713_1_plen_151_part_10
MEVEGALESKPAGIGKPTADSHDVSTCNGKEGGHRIKPELKEAESLSSIEAQAMSSPLSDESAAETVVCVTDGPRTTVSSVVQVHSAESVESSVKSELKLETADSKASIPDDCVVEGSGSGWELSARMNGAYGIKVSWSAPRPVMEIKIGI